jgi:hypothetical protein
LVLLVEELKEEEFRGKGIWKRRDLEEKEFGEREKSYR